MASPAGQSPVPDYGNHIVVLPGQVPGTGNAQSRRDGGAGMSGAEAVIGAFTPFGEPAQAPVLPQGGKLFQTPGEQLVDVGLVPHVPHNLVPGHGEHLMEGYGKLHHSQVGRQMAPVFAGNLQDLVPDFLAQFRQFPHWVFSLNPTVRVWLVRFS